MMSSEDKYVNQAALADRSEAEYSSHIYQRLDDFETVYHGLQNKQPDDREDEYEDMASVVKPIKQMNAAENNIEKRTLISHFSIKLK